MGWLILPVILGALILSPVSLSLIYQGGKAEAWLTYLPVRIRLYPGNKKPAKKPAAAPRSTAPPPEAEEKKDLSERLRPLMRVWEVLRKNGKLPVKELVVKLTLGGTDPCDLAVNYGRAWAALGSLIPRLEDFLRIRKRDLGVQCDFTSETTTVYAKACISIPLFKALRMLIQYGKSSGITGNTN